MKKTLLLVAVAALVAVSFTSCNNDKTYTELLTQSKGWVLSAASTSPSYLLSDGSYATDLINDGYLYAYEVDDIITFAENGAETINPGKLIDTTAGYQAEVATTWSFDNAENPTTITMQLPFFYNAAGTSYDTEAETCTILSLTSEEFRIKYTFNAESTAKEAYSFTLTYVPAK